MDIVGWRDLYLAAFALTQHMSKTEALAPLIIRGASRGSDEVDEAPLSDLLRSTYCQAVCFISSPAVRSGVRQGKRSKIASCEPATLDELYCRTMREKQFQTSHLKSFSFKNLPQVHNAGRLKHICREISSLQQICLLVLPAAFFYVSMRTDTMPCHFSSRAYGKGEIPYHWGRDV